MAAFFGKDTNKDVFRSFWIYNVRVQQGFFLLFYFFYKIRFSDISIFLCKFAFHLYIFHIQHSVSRFSKKMRKLYFFSRSNAFKSYLSFSIIFLHLEIEIIFRELWSIINVLIPCIVTEYTAQKYKLLCVLESTALCSFLKKIVAYKMTTAKDNFD